jgi:hypothetical protein
MANIARWILHKTHFLQTVSNLPTELKNQNQYIQDFHDSVLNAWLGSGSKLHPAAIT